MIVFLDTSTILAACWSTKGLSHVLIEHRLSSGWRLITADYCVAEVERNVLKHISGATRWNRNIRPILEVVGSIYVIDRPIVFDATKDRPVIPAQLLQTGSTHWDLWPKESQARRSANKMACLWPPFPTKRRRGRNPDRRRWLGRSGRPTSLFGLDRCGLRPRGKC